MRAAGLEEDLTAHDRLDPRQEGGEREPYRRRGGWLGRYLGSGEVRRGGQMVEEAAAARTVVGGEAEEDGIVAFFWLLPRRTLTKFRRTTEQCGGASVLECSRRRGE
jgi:hypothetical protein